MTNVTICVRIPNELDDLNYVLSVSGMTVTEFVRQSIREKITQMTKTDEFKELERVYEVNHTIIKRNLVKV